MDATVLTIVCTVISSAFSFAIAMITTSIQHSKSMAEVKKDIQYMSEQIDRLETKQDKHNQLIERTYQLEEQVHVLQATCPMKHNNN